eukprot:g1740.t1
MAEPEDLEFKTMFGAKVSKSSDVEPHILRKCVEFLNDRLQDNNITAEKMQEHVLGLKALLDKDHGYPWNCIAGTNYGTHITGARGTFAFFYINNYAITIYKVGI